MATQSGITISAPNAPYTITNDIPVPTLASKTALVKSLYTGINPVEPFMYHTGLLIESFPAVLGSDAAGVVLSTSPDCTKLRVGDYVYGCVPIGLNAFSPFQETFLVDERWIFKKAERIGLEEASTIGAGVLTAGLILVGLGISLPSPDTTPEEKDEWIVVLGGSGSVGRYVAQIARIAGYKVVASSSKGKVDLAIASGANATFDNRASEADQLNAIKRITAGRFCRVVDASAQGAELAVKALVTLGTGDEKYFTTVDDWSPMELPSSLTVHRVKLGLLGRVGEPEGQKVTALAADMIQKFEPYLETGKLTALDYDLAGGTGWQAIIDALAGYEAGKFAKKVIVKVQDE